MTVTGEKARAQAIRLLKFRPRSEAELKQRLVRKGVPEPEALSLVQEFKQKGFVDDAKLARYLVTQQMLAKPVGRRMLLSRLKSRGVDAGLAQKAVEQGTEGRDELELARQTALSRFERLRDLPRETADRRLFGFLSRRGFSTDIVYKVVRELRDTVRSSTSSE